MNWCFTINNPVIDDIKGLEELACKNQLRMLIMCLEKGDSDTLHYQGYLELHHTKGLNVMKKYLPRAHLEKRRGTKNQAVKYCLKDQDIDNKLCNDVGFHTIGITETIPPIYNILYYQSEGYLLKNYLNPIVNGNTKNANLLKMKELIEKGATDQELAEIDFPTWLRNHKGLREYRLLKAEPRDHEVTTIVIQGPTGTGKSKWAKENYPNAYWKQRSQWWDGYTNQETIILDEFYGWLPFDLILRLCDRYPLLLEVKGGQVHCVAKTIIFTTNSLPSSWYKATTYWKAFERRVSEWRILPIWGEMKLYENYDLAVSEMNSNTF